jgi:hypothetical protein
MTTGEQGRHEMAGPSIAHPINDYLNVPVHELPVDRIYSADRIIVLNSLIGSCRTIFPIGPV